MTLDECKKKHEAERRWMNEHFVQAAFINLFDFFRYTIPRVSSDWKYEIIYAKDRVIRGYDDRMIFSYHYENAEQTLKVLKWLRHHRDGSPMTCKHTTACKCDPHKSWNMILDKMISGFQANLDLDDVHILTDGKYDHKKSQEKRRRLWKKWQVGGALYIEQYFGLWD
jgi:hypothetical protein